MLLASDEKEKGKTISKQEKSLLSELKNLV